MTEQTLKRSLMDAIKRLTPEAVAIRHEDRYTHGIPDISYSLNRRTTWWEIKYADPHVESKGVQKYLCQRLDAASFCRYIIFQRGIPVGPKKRPRAIRIVMPREIDCWQVSGRIVEEGSFDLWGLVAYIARVHGVQI